MTVNNTERGERTDLEGEVDFSWKINEKRFDDTCWLRALMSKCWGWE